MKIIINTTPHPVTMVSQEGRVYTIEPCGTLINARPVEEAAGTHPSGAALVRTRFVADPASEEALSRLGREPGRYYHRVYHCSPSISGPGIRNGACAGI